MDEHFRKLERMYHGAPVNAWFRPRLVVRPREAEVTIEIRPEFFHAARAAHGVVAFKAIDDACFFAANSEVRDSFVLTASLALDFLRPVTGGTVVGRGRVVHRSERRILCEGTVVDSAGKEVARGSASFMPSRVPLTVEIGYE